MALIATVTAKGLAICAGPSPTAKVIDKLTVGDQIRILESAQVVPNWSYGEIIKIANGVYAEAREGKRGWFYTVDTVSVTDDRPRIDPDFTPSYKTPLWMWGVVSLFVLAAAFIAFWR